MKLLCAGDIHIGRRSTRIPGATDEDALSPVSCWYTIVDRAITGQFDVVALSGDLIDQSNKYFEAVAPLERGLQRLAAAGIVTVAVCGNHDHDVLPQIAQSCNPEWFRLLGVGGRWERTLIERKNGDRLYVDGWSFPAEHVVHNPMAGYTLPPSTDAPTLGLLHADLNAVASRYAPVALSDLQGRGAAMWLLGHIHAPSLHRVGGTVVLYPGSPQALAPDEPGLHGVWTVDLRPGTKSVLPMQEATSGVRYESVVIDITGHPTLSDIRTCIHATLQERFQVWLTEGHTTYISVRLTLTGNSRLHRQLKHVLDPELNEYVLTHNQSTLVIERVVVDTRPSRDLDALARGSDAAAAIAQLILALETNTLTDDHRRLLHEAEQATNEVRHSKAFRPIQMESDGVTSDAIRETLRTQGIQLLEELLVQKEERISG